MGLILTIVQEGLNKLVLFKNSSLCSLGSNSKDSKFSGGIAKLVLFEIRFRNPFPKGGSGMNSKQSWNRARFRPEGRNFFECQNYFKALKNSPRMEESERSRIKKSSNRNLRKSGEYLSPVFIL